METWLAGLFFGIAAASPVAGEERWPVAAIALLAALVVWWRQGWQRQAGASLVAGILAGMIATWWQQPEPVVIPQESLTKAIPLTAVLADREDRLDGGARLWLDQVTWSEGNWRANGMVRVVVRRQTITAMPGDRIRLTAKLRPLDRPEAPWGFAYQSWLRRNGIVAEGSSSTPVTVIGSTGEWFWNYWRQRVSNRVAAVASPQQQGLTEVMLVGKKGRLSMEVMESLQAAGIYHLVAISGLQLSMMAGWFFLVIRGLLACWLPWSRTGDVKRPAAFLAIWPTLAYGALTGWSVATQRATLMVGIYLLAITLGRAYQVGRSMGWAATLLLLWQPEQLFDAGFALSFVAVSVLILVIPLMEPRPTPAQAALQPRLPIRYRDDPVWWRRWWRIVLIVAATSLAVDAVMLPMSAHFFHRISIYALPANLLAGPLVNLFTVPMGLAALLATPIWPDLGDGLITLVAWSMELVRIPCIWVAELPGGWWRTPGPPLTGLVLFLALLAWAVLPGRWWLRGVAAAGAVAALFWPGPSLPPGLTVAVLDVGQAQAAVVRSANGAWSLVDAGGSVSPFFNIGEAMISGFLWNFGATELERVMISHPQSDHMAGAERILRNFRVKSLWLPPMSSDDQAKPMMQTLIARAAQQGVPIREVSNGVTEVDANGGGEPALHWRILHPKAGFFERHDNDRSLVAEATYGTHRFLFPGDLEHPGEHRVLDRGQVLPVTVVVAPHHGSRTSSSREFVSALQPREVVFSVGAYNRYHFPDGGVVRRWREGGAITRQTDHDGSVLYHSDGKNLQVRTVRQWSGGAQESNPLQP